MLTISSVPYLTFAETQKRLGYKTRKSVSDLVAAGRLTPIRPKILQGKHAPRIYFDETEVNALAPNPNRLSRVQAAERLGVHPRTVDRMAQRGQLIAYPASAGARRKIEFDVREVEAVRDELIQLGLQES